MIAWIVDFLIVAGVIAFFYALYRLAIHIFDLDDHDRPNGRPK